MLQLGWLWPCPQILRPDWKVKNIFFVSNEAAASQLECLYLAITFQSSLTFAGNTRSLPKKEASERHSKWVGSLGPVSYTHLTLLESKLVFFQVSMF